MIKPVSYATILDAPNTKELMHAYAAECAAVELGEAHPQRELYDILEKSGGFQAFAVYEGETIVGFACVLIYVLPHFGKKIAASESIFVLQGHSGGGPLLRIMKEHAKASGCEKFIYSAPLGSRFDRVLASRLRRTNNVYIENL